MFKALIYGLFILFSFACGSDNEGQRPVPAIDCATYRYQLYHSIETCFEDTCDQTVSEKYLNELEFCMGVLN